jgi:hypothetical protein
MDIPLVPCPHWLATGSQLIRLSCRSSLYILRMDCIKSLLCDLLTPFSTMVTLAQPTSVSTVVYIHLSVSSLIPARTLMTVLLSLLLHKLKTNSYGVQYMETERVCHLSQKLV